MGSEDTPGDAGEPTGGTVADNIVRVRGSRRLTLRQLSERLAGIGHPMSTSALNRIENRTRKVDVDDLMALAVALDVSPLGLLLPRSERASDAVEVTGLARSADVIWSWVAGVSSTADEEVKTDWANYNSNDITEVSMPRWLALSPLITRFEPGPLGMPRRWPHDSAAEPMYVARTEHLKPTDG